MTECYVWLANKFIYGFIKSLAYLPALDWVLDEFECFFVLCIGLNIEHPLLFVDVTERELNVEADELFDVEMLQLLWRLWCWLVFPYWNID